MAAASDRPALRRGLRVGVLLTLIALVVFSALMVVYAKYQSRVLFVELQALQQVRDRMDEEWGRLQLEQSTWATHGHIEDTARNRLQMVLPESKNVVVIW